MDCSLPISSVHGILWARILKWVAMPSSRGSSQPRDQTHISYVSALAGGFFTNSTTCCCSVPQLCTAICDPMTAAYYTSLSFPSLGACSDSCLLSRWCHPTISSSVFPFSCLQSFPASRPFLMSWLFTSGDQSIGASASASVLLMDIQDWFPLGLMGLIPLESKGLSGVFSTVQKHQFFGVQPSLWSNSHICTWLLEKP